jgi:hypothetical protein
MVVDENTPHARDCPAGENILDLPGKSCDCGLELFRESQRKPREGYQRWLAEKRAKCAGVDPARTRGRGVIRQNPRRERSPNFMNRRCGNAVPRVRQNQVVLG